MSEWRSACVIAPYPPELLPNTPRRPGPPHPKRCSIAGSISRSRKSSQAPVEADSIGMGQAAAREPDEIDQEGQSLSVMPSRDVNVDDAHRRIAQHIILED